MLFKLFSLDLLHFTNQAISETNTKEYMPNDINWNDIYFLSPVQMFLLAKLLTFVA